MAILDRPSKRAKLLDGYESGSESEDTTQYAPAVNGFKINEEYAKRFEHNKKREEQHQLEEKYGKSVSQHPRKRDREDDESGDENEDEDSSDDESEDNDAEFATEDVDDEILATMQAIRNKDPRLYDQGFNFYKAFEPDVNGGDAAKRKDRPIYLNDYHRQNLMAQQNGEEPGPSNVPIQTYQDEQDQLRRELVGSMHATAADHETGSDKDDFLVAKSKPKRQPVTSIRKHQLTEQDIVEADKDPETYLSNFMAARAWLPTESSKWEAFESDDSDDDARADQFEEAYNMRFEDPAMANEKLQSFARDVGETSARRDDKTGRKRAREREKEKRGYEKQARDEERARLRKLKIEEAEEKVKKIKDAAGIRGREVDLEQWRDIIEADFDDDKWEEDMQKRFGEAYYAAGEEENGFAEHTNEAAAKKRLTKPKWDDDIDINDIVPDFDNDEGRPAFTLSSDDEAQDGTSANLSDTAKQQDHGKSKKKSNHVREKADVKRNARKERRKIEEFVDSTLPFDHPSLAASMSVSTPPSAGFRYRESSPTSFGLSTRDILFANDAQLNQFAGLKKLASFRDSDKKRKDKKRLSKKARLREWRKETFGDQNAPVGGFERLLGRQDDEAHDGAFGRSVGNGEKKIKKKRSRGSKSGSRAGTRS